MAIRTKVHAADELWRTVEEIGVRFDGHGQQDQNAERIRELADQLCSTNQRLTIEDILNIAELIRSVARFSTREI